MPTLEQIRKNKYTKLVEKYKTRERESLIDSDDIEKKQLFVFKNILTEDAFDYFAALKELEFDIYFAIGLTLIKRFELIPPFIDWIIEDIFKGKIPIKIPKDDIIKLERAAKGIKAQINVIRDGEKKSLKEAILGNKDEEM